MSGLSDYDAGKMASTIEDLEKRLNKAEERIDDLRSWQRWVIGGAAGIALMLGFFMDWIKQRLGLK